MLVLVGAPDQLQFCPPLHTPSPQNEIQHSKYKCWSWLVYYSPDDGFTTTSSPIPPNSREKKMQEKFGQSSQKSDCYCFREKKGAVFPVKDCTRFVCTAVLHGTTNIRAKANFRLKGFEKLWSGEISAWAWWGTPVRRVNWQHGGNETWTSRLDLRPSCSEIQISTEM